MARGITPQQFAVELLEAAVKVKPAARAVVAKGALNIKNQVRKNVAETAPTHNAHAAYAITYDEPTGILRIESEIGYDKDLPGGAIGNLLEYGGGGDHSPPHRDINRAADEEEGRFGDALHTMAMKLL